MLKPMPFEIKISLLYRYLYDLEISCFGLNSETGSHIIMVNSLFSPSGVVNVLVVIFSQKDSIDAHFYLDILCSHKSVLFNPLM